MGYIIAVAGKGGTGKTTISALLVNLIKQKKLGTVLAVDADPNSNLGESLGIEISETVGSIVDQVGAHPDKIPAGLSKDRFIEYSVETALCEAGGFDLLSMGRPEGAGCYCFVNNILRNVISKFINNYDYIVIDNEAGLEHFSRRTTRVADCLLVVSDASKVGLSSAKRINSLVDELKIKVSKRYLIINRSDCGIDKKIVEDTGLEYLGSLPVDEQISEISLSGGSLSKLTDKSVVLSKLGKLGEKIWQKN